VLDPECPKDWAERLLPMATCNKCWDFRTGRDNLTEKIERLAVKFMREIRLKVKIPETERPKMLDDLARHCHEYMSIIAEYNHHTWAGDVGPTVAAIVKEPWLWQYCIRDLRYKFRQTWRNELDFRNIE
jgi:hypothetical protein